ncbi:hypothetical protein MJG53_015605 [Ovis ammon polii x Ovis aries]|uniref:Uncharacterized protein n=1 Tax=Ovis ammon polii x Ovis aries TaxID=2918886 RepID=A0ACB9UFN3_9CETA|nr:hypothetical protein MJG53_015605 [Ovis ammon polii x Ovis aries]
MLWRRRFANRVQPEPSGVDGAVSGSSLETDLQSSGSFFRAPGTAPLTPHERQSVMALGFRGPWEEAVSPQTQMAETDSMCSHACLGAPCLVKAQVLVCPPPRKDDVLEAAAAGEGPGKAVVEKMSAGGFGKSHMKTIIQRCKDPCDEMSINALLHINPGPWQ